MVHVQTWNDSGFENTRNEPKFLGIKVWANSADPDQTASREQSDQSDQGLHCFVFSFA